MKYFLASFSVCLIVSYLFLFYFGNIMIENSWSALLLAAIIALVVLILIFRQEKRLSEMENRFNETTENYRIRIEGLEKQIEKRKKKDADNGDDQ